MNHHIYDVIIIGGGPGGLSAAIYSARARLKTLIVESKSKPGGLCATTSEVENYPGVLKGRGLALMKQFALHAQHFGAEIIQGTVKSLDLSDDNYLKTLYLKDNYTLKAKSIIIATGTRPRVLGIPGENEFTGKGVSYCATCDADFYTELNVIVVGSGNTAVEEAIFLTHYVNTVTMVVVHDENHLDADMITVEQAYLNPGITFLWNSVVSAIHGDELVEGVDITNLKTGRTERVPTDGVFIFIGSVPQTGWLKHWQVELPLTSSGYIEVNNQQETRIPGVFAVGDVCNKFLRQVVTAAGDGAVAAVAACQYLEQIDFWQKQMLASDFHLVLFWSPTDRQSVVLKSALEQKISRDVRHSLMTVDIYKNQRIAHRFHVDELPTLLCLQYGKECYRLVKPDVEDADAILQEFTR
ncbi:thioredoxin-disulfide reductase [Enterobacter ludwigii]|uniref:thioredoxin-disulfide reductase n=1 Tax=Enterobacter ludwigii TaxID=299767 RepID=UPI003976CB19